MDRDSANIPKSQIGFIKFVIEPMVISWCKYNPESKLLTWLHATRDHWDAELAKQPPPPPPSVPVPVPVVQQDNASTPVNNQ